MPKVIKVRVPGFGVSIDSLDIMYNISGSTTLVTAANACGELASGLTQVQLLSGYTVYLPDNAANVYVLSNSGPCAGTITAGTVVPA